MASLLGAAAAVFAEKGYDAATMTEIAARAGASIGTLYLFFATKPALAQALTTELADALTGRLDAVGARAAGQPAAAVAEALFDELEAFSDANPVYGILVELPGDDAWRVEVRARRRGQIAALFAGAAPPLPPGQAERLAVVVPQLMRAAIVLGAEMPALRGGVRDELRTMLHRHLAWPPAPGG